MITAVLQSEIEKAVKTRILSVAPLSAANNAQIYRLALDSGHTLVTKIAEHGLDVEAYMINYLREKSQLPVPQVYYSNEHVIVMQCLEGSAMIDDGAQRHGAELLAALHQIRGEQYGHDRNTLVGSLLQPNKQTTDWTYFFIEQRLLYMAREALKESKIDAKMMKAIDKLATRIPGMLKDNAPPSLIHGDVWSGNVLAARGRIAGFLDPAIYYADPEIELAFIRLFNSFNGLFFARYNEINPIRPGFYEERADIYSIYPLLVHTRLFGPSYARKVQKILDRFA